MTAGFSSHDDIGVLDQLSNHQLLKEEGIMKLVD
jgi:hypothetical protein